MKTLQLTEQICELQRDQFNSICPRVQTRSVTLIKNCIFCCVFFSQILCHFKSAEQRMFRVFEYNPVRIRHDRNTRFSKSLSHLEIYYSRLTPVISHLLIVNTMLPMRLKKDRQYWNREVWFQICWLFRCSIMPGSDIYFKRRNLFV